MHALKMSINITKPHDDRIFITVPDLNYCEKSPIEKLQSKTLKIHTRVNPTNTIRRIKPLPDPLGRKSRLTMLSNTEDFPELYKNTIIQSNHFKKTRKQREINHHD